MSVAKRATTALAVALVIASAVSTATASRSSNGSTEPGIRIKRMAQVPLNLTFRDENNREVALGQYFKKGRPVIMVFVYFRCPQLCPLVLKSLTWSISQLDWDPGNQYEIVTMSFDSTDTPADAKLQKQRYSQMFGRPSASRGWHFLTGSKENVKAVANAAGFFYKYDPDTRRFKHNAGIFILTPDGRVSQCMTGLGKRPAGYDPHTLKLSLIRASNGQQGSILEKFVLWCCPYDPGTGKYTANVWNITRLLCGVLLVGVALFVVPVWLRSRHRHSRSQEPKSS